jgi:prevent-host-death family protein
MATVGIRELKNQVSELIRRVEAGEQVAITNPGRVVARLVPAAVTPEDIDRSLAILDELDDGDEDGAWPETATLETIMDEVRR